MPSVTRFLSPPLPGPGWLGGPGEVEQVDALGLVELKRAGHTLEDSVGGAGEVPAFHADVVVDADAGEERHLLAP